MHLITRVHVTGLRSDNDAVGQELAGLILTTKMSEKLAILKVAGDVARVSRKEFLEVFAGGIVVTDFDALKRQPVARKSVIGLLSEEGFERVAARFLSLRHRMDERYYIGRRSRVQARRPDGILASGEPGRMAKQTKAQPKKVLMNEGAQRGQSTAGAERVGKPVSASISEIVEIVLPNDANLVGNMLGGRVMHLIDIAGALAATRHSNCPVVTASVDYLDFRFPIHIGEWIVLKSSVNRVFRTSMEVGVKVFAENTLTGERRHTSTAYVTYVAIDMNKNPCGVPPLIIETEDERRRWKEAGERRQHRLEIRYKETLKE